MGAMEIPKARNRTQTVSYYSYTIGAHRIVQCGTGHFANRTVQCERSAPPCALIVIVNNISSTIDDGWVEADSDSD